MLKDSPIFSQYLPMLIARVHLKVLFPPVHFNIFQFLKQRLFRRICCNRLVHLRGAQHVFSVGRKEPIEFHVELHVLTIGARHLDVFPFARIMMAVNLQNISKYLVYRPCLSLWLRFQEMTWCQLTSWKRRPEESLNLQGLHNNI